MPEQLTSNDLHGLDTRIDRCERDRVMVTMTPREARALVEMAKRGRQIGAGKDEFSQGSLLELVK